MMRAMHKNCRCPWERLPPPSEMMGIVAIWHTLYEAVGVGLFRRSDDLSSEASGRP